MRTQIFDAMHRRMAVDPRLFLVIGDMGINLVERFGESYPDRFVNVGIAEQNMIGVCAGLFNVGYRPVAYTICNFAVHRCFEQIRNEIGIHKYPVVVLGISTGFDNAPLGPTHHMVDDWGALRAIHGIEVHCPSSKTYAAHILDDVLDRGVSAYIRIPKGEFTEPDSRDAVVHMPGSVHDTLLVTYGGIAQAAIRAQRMNSRLSVMVVNQLRPLDQAQLGAIWSSYARLVVVEDHFAETGLFASVCEIVATQRLDVSIESRAPCRYTMEVGCGPEYFWKRLGADPESLARIDEYAGAERPP